MKEPSSSGKFKGWVIPGPKLTEAAIEKPVPTAEESLDALCGYYKIFQLKNGHRFSTDDLLVAWYATVHAPGARTALDLGSGLGTVAMVTAWRLPGVRMLSVEAQEVSAALCKKSVQYNELQNRFELRVGDFRSCLKEDETFDLITGSPPYFPLDAGVQSAHPQKVACRFEVRGDVFDYCSVAAKHLNPGGVCALVFPVDPPHQERRVLDAAEKAGLQIIKRRDVCLREGETPLIGVFILMRKEDLPESERSLSYKEKNLTIRLTDGQVHSEYKVIKLSLGFPP